MSVFQGELSSAESIEGIEGSVQRILDVSMLFNTKFDPFFFVFEAVFRKTT